MNRTIARGHKQAPIAIGKPAPKGVAAIFGLGCEVDLPQQRTCGGNGADGGLGIHGIDDAIDHDWICRNTLPFSVAFADIHAPRQRGGCGQGRMRCARAGCACGLCPIGICGHRRRRKGHGLVHNAILGINDSIGVQDGID